MSVNLPYSGRTRNLSVTAAIITIAVFFALPVLPGELSAADAGAGPAYSVDISGELAVVGASWEDGYRGAAYVLRRDGDSWAVEQRIVPSDLGMYDHFGGSVKIDGDRIIVTSPWHDLQRGASYEFRLDGGRWVQDSKIPASKDAVAGKLSANMLLAGGLPQDDSLPAEAIDLFDTLKRETGSTPPLAAPAALVAPSWVSASDGTYEDRVEITWENTEQDEVLYKVLRNDTLLSFVSSDGSYYSDETVTLGQTAEYCVVVTDMVAEETTPVCDDGTRIIFAPTSFTGSNGQYTDGVHLSWIDMSSINDGYVIYRDSVPIDSTGANATSFLDDTVPQGRIPYAYEVTAYVDGGYESAAAADDGWRAEILPPQSVSASAGQYLDRVVVTWLDQAPDATGYRIYRKGTLIDSTGVGVETYTDSTVVFGVLYDYCVTAVGAGGIESIRICDDGNAGLTTPGNVSASDSTYDDRVQVTWEDLSDYEDGYEIVRDVYVSSGTGKNDTRPIVTASLDSVVVGTVGADVEVFDDMTAEPGAMYVYYVRAFSTEGGVSLYGEDLGFCSVVLAPTGVEATDGDYEDRTYITWESASTTAVSFMIFRDGALIKSVDESQKYYNDMGGVAGQEYSYIVKAITAMGDTSTSTLNDGRRELKNPAPVTADDNAFEDRVIIGWTDNSAVEDGYRVYRRAVADTDSVLITTTDPNRTSFVDYLGTSAVTYVYSVAAYDTTLGGTDGESPAAQDGGGRLLIAPTSVTATDGTYEDRVEMTWDDNSNAEDGYYIYRDAALIDSTADNYTSYTDNSPVLGTQHVYSIAAFDAIGPSAASSDEGYIDILAPFSVNASDFYQHGIELSWIDQSNIEDGYRIYRDGSIIATLNEADRTSYIDVYYGPAGTVGSYDTPGSAQGIAVAGNYAYVANRSYGLYVIDISDPANPSLEGGCDTPGFAGRVVILGNYAYVADESYGLQVINISDPSNPMLEGHCDTPDYAGGLVVVGNYAYVAVRYSGLHVIDISDPANPIIEGNYDTPDYASDVAVVGNYAYVADGISGLQVIDVSIPSNPVSEGTCDTPGIATGIAVAGNYAYVADNVASGLQVINISDPSNPTLAGNSDSPEHAVSVAIAGNYAYVADWSFGLKVIDISDPANPVLEVSHDTPGDAADVAVVGNYAYIAANTDGLQIVIPMENPEIGTDYGYCVRAYSSSVESDSGCDTGIIPATVTESETTRLFTKLLASDPDPLYAGNDFGADVSISGDRVIVGANLDDENGSNAGAAFIFERDAGGAWTQKQKLLASDLDAVYVQDYFGRSVSISGDRAVIGAYNDDENGSNAGAAYVFERDAGGAWTQTQKLLASDLDAVYVDDWFGGCVSISGDRAVVGAYYDDENGGNAGAAYVFERDAGGAWTQKQKLLASDLDALYAEDRFGYGVSISGDRVIVGAYFDDENGDAAGAAYVFERDAGGAWTQTQKLLASDLDAVYALDFFGRSVSISGDRVIVGAHSDDENGNDAGAAYVFERDAGGAWTQKQKLLASDLDAVYASDYFGDVVSISGDRAIVGAFTDDENGESAGAAYVFERDAGGAWTQTQKLLASDLDPVYASGLFGCSVSISGDRAVVGDLHDNENGTYEGAAYILDKTGAGMVAATDGTQDSRIRVTWNDGFDTESGFLIYRDGELHGSRTAPDVESYNDTEALRGRTYEYCVKAVFAVSDTIELGCDFGWRPPNGGVTGRVTTRGGAGVNGIPVFLDPPLTGAILCDGVTGNICVREADAFNFGTSSNFTVETWVRYSGSGGTVGTDKSIISKANSYSNFPFVLRTDGGNGNPGRLVFAMNDGLSSASVTSSDTLSLNDNKWHHVACVYNGDLTELNLYVDGEFDGSASAAGLGDITNDDDLFFGRGRSDLFRGQVDEVRIWSTARTDVQINSSMTLQPDGDEPGLVGYWPFDEGEGSAVTDFAGTAQYGVLSEGVYWTDDVAPIDISADTDIEGNYVHTGLRFEDGDTLFVRPSEGERQFQPAFKTVVLSEQSPSVNEISFVEISSYTVSGQIMFAGSGCPVPNARILLDGSALGVTDKNGKYAVSAGNGEHTLAAELEGHAFLPADTLLIVDSDMTADFTNTTLHSLSGSVGGGCGRYVGDVTVTFESRNGCMIEALAADSTTASYSISIPPQVYHVSAEVEPSSIPAELNDQDVIDFFDDLGVREVDLSAVTDTTLDFIYRAPLVIAIEGFEDYVPVCPQLSVDGDTLPSGIPVVPQFEYVTLQIRVDEDYGPSGTCPLDTGTVTIYDEIFDQPDTPVTIPVSDGIAEYTTFASTPSLISGRMVEGVNRSYQKSITVHAAAEGQNADPVSEWILVTGHVAQEGFEFVTFAGSVQPEYILRDPPGDNSYSYLDEGYSSCANLQLGGSFTSGSGVELEIAWGVDEAFFIGLGAGTIKEIEIKQENKFKATRSWTASASYKTETCLSFNDRFSTSSNDLFTGERGDVFIGAGTNYIFAEVNVIEIEGCDVVRSTSIGVQPEGFHTTFAYTQQHIEDALIPELDDRVAYYLSIEEPDSAEIYQDARDDWQRMLDMNDELKLSSQLSENRSFSAGAEYEYTHTSETTQSFSSTLTLRAGLEWEHGIKVELFGNDFKLTTSVFMNAEVSAGVGGTGTTTETVGYVLNDDDIGDNFTVDVKADGSYPSPVFDVLAGVSSCPWEAWPDTSGAARMTPRDGAALLVNPVTAEGVPADEAAIFNFTLVNESGSEEARWYTLRLLVGSNPYGAVILVNGSAFITEGLDFFLEPYEAQQVTMTIERGPELYSYDSLKVMLYPVCEYAIWERHGAMQLADVRTINVHFDPPCSEIALDGPADGWTHDRAMQTAGDSMLVMLSGYDRDLGSPGEGMRIDYAGAQYRRLGSDDEGPDEWAVCGAVIMYADLPDDNVTMKWLPPDALEDGAYELRAFTHCADGEGYSETVTGTIDRHSPVVFGTPQPSDGILSFGEDVSITFNELIDSLSIDEGDITLKYLDGPNADSLIALTAVCNGSTIVISPTEDVGDLEGRRIEASVSGITDCIGNPLEAAAVWEFDYRRSQFAWSDADIVMEGALGNPGKLMAELVNGTGEPVDFSFPGLPSWITGVIPSTGTILPGETQLVELVIQTDLAAGIYHDEVRAEATDGSNVSFAVLTIDLSMSCQAPDWAVNPNSFEHSMAVVAKLDIEGVKSTDRADMVAAYVGGQLRGVASIDSVHVYDSDTGYDYSWLAFLTVYSNRPSGETVRFQVWDGSECRLYSATEETHPFVADGQAGTPDAPVTLTATDVIGGEALAIEVQEGWNWISTNIWTADMSVTNILADLNLSSGDLIKSQTAFSQFIEYSHPDSIPQWVPVFDFDNVSAYLLNLAQAGTIIHTGSAVSVDSIVPVAQGWNWIGYLPAGSMAVDVALGDLDVGSQDLLIDNDIIKGQDGFAQYLGGEWYGTLAEMEPGHGYKLSLANAIVTGFNYPVYVGALAEPPVVVADAEATGSGAVAEGEQAVSAPDWAVNPYAYQFNMTVTAVLRVDGLESVDGRDIIAAFVDSECRGMASPEYVGGPRRYEAFLMIHSNEPSGETVEFRVFDADEGVICEVTEQVDWEADAVLGTVTQPFVLSAVSGEEEQDGGVPKAFALMQNVPNPFNPSTTIYYDVPSGGGNVSLRIYDVSGRLVRTLVDGHQTEGSRSITWNGTNNRGQRVASGIYFYRMAAPGFTETKKMVLLR